MNRHTFARLILSTVGLAIGLYAMLWLLPFMTYGVHYTTGEPAQYSFDPVLTAGLSVGAAVLFAIVIPYLPGKADGHRRR